MTRHLALLALLTLLAVFTGTPFTRTAFADEPHVVVRAKPVQELNLNFFRNPSVGLEYRRGVFAVHAGLYPTIVSKDEMGVSQTSWFARAGLTTFFLPRRWYGQRPSELYVSASYLRGLNLGHGHAALLDVGYRWMVWRGLNVRLGAAMLIEPGHAVKINPTPGVGWSTSW